METAAVVGGFVLAAFVTALAGWLASRALKVVEQYQKQLSLAAELLQARIKEDDVFAYNQRRLSDATAAGRIGAEVKDVDTPAKPKVVGPQAFIRDDTIPASADIDSSLV